MPGHDHPPRSRTATSRLWDLTALPSNRFVEYTFSSKSSKGVWRPACREVNGGRRCVFRLDGGTAGPIPGATPLYQTRTTRGEYITHVRLVATPWQTDTGTLPAGKVYDNTLKLDQGFFGRPPTDDGPIVEEENPLRGGNVVGDVNGDLRADRLAWNEASAWVERSTESGFAPGQQWAIGTPFYGTRGNFLADVNGDNRADMVAWNDASAWVQLSTGSGFAVGQQWTYGTAFYGT